MAAAVYMEIPVDHIEFDPELNLRTPDDKDERYQRLKNAIQVAGYLKSKPIEVREIPGRPGRYFVTDGGHRWTACRQIGLLTIPAIIDNDKFDEAAFRQIMANENYVPTRPVHKTRQIIKLINRPEFQGLPIRVVLKKMGLETTPQWFQRTLNLINLNEEAASLVDGGKITLSNAVALAKLPHAEQTLWIDRATTTTPDQFIADVSVRAAELKKAKTGDESPADFYHGATVRKLTPIKDRCRDLESRVNLAKVSSLQRDSIEPEDWLLLESFFTLKALQWAINRDEETIRVREETKKQTKEQREAAMTGKRDLASKLAKVNDPEALAKLNELLASAGIN